MLKYFYCFVKINDCKRNSEIFSLMQLYQEIFQTSFVCLGCTSIKVLKSFYVMSLEMSSN